MLLLIFSYIFAQIFKLDAVKTEDVREEILQRKLAVETEPIKKIEILQQINEAIKVNMHNKNNWRILFILSFSVLNLDEKDSSSVDKTNSYGRV
jgi:hypothetical protein